MLGEIFTKKRELRTHLSAALHLHRGSHAQVKLVTLGAPRSL